MYKGLGYHWAKFGNSSRQVYNSLLKKIKQILKGLTSSNYVADLCFEGKFGDFVYLGLFAKEMASANYGDLVNSMASLL